MSAVPEPRQPSVATMINRDLSNPNMLAQLKAALPEHVSVEKFVRTVLTAIQSSAQLMQVDRTSLLKACMEAAADGLLPDGREGAIVPYKGSAQWQPMVWGLVKLVRNSGQLSSIGAEIVRDNDRFERWIDEAGPHFKHTPSIDGAGKPVGVYAYALTKDGGVYIEYMTWAEIERFRALSKSDRGPWKDWPEEMAKVRPIKRLCKRLPMSTDALAAIERDDRRDAEHMAGANPDPIAALNASIAGTTAPALANNPSPSVTFDAVEEMLRKARGVADLDAAVTAALQVPDAEQRDELLAMAEVRRHEMSAPD